MDFYEQLYGERTASDQAGFIKNTEVLNVLSWKKESMFVVFDAARYKVLYFCDNFQDIFGYSSEELNRYNILLFFRALDKKHLTFPFTTAKWASSLFRHYSAGDLKAGLRFTFCGIMVRHKNGEILRLLVNYFPMEVDEHGNPTLVIVTIKNINYLLKGEFYWARMSCGPNLEKVSTYHSATKQSKFEDIISEREKEVLKHIIEGKSSKEIADILFLSPNTVEKHRKNMLAKTGARDTTALSLIMGFLGKKIKNEGLNMAGLASFLGSQKSSIMAALPSGMGSMLGMADMGNVSAPKTGGFNWMPWAIGILVLLALLYFWKGCDKPPVVDQVQNAAEQATETVTDAAQDVADATTETVSGLGEFFSKKLACGIEMNIPSNGIEARLAAFIEDASKPVDKTTWFDFDRLTFETGKASLDMSKSEEQLKNIAEIMKCYPKVKLKVGGYTDNVGNAQANMKLSQGRADNVKAALVALGVAADRMEAEGYGDQHPVASNDTEEGRAQNRRISTRVMEK